MLYLVSKITFVIILYFVLLGVPLVLALVRGDIKSMFKYADNPELEEDKKEEKKDN